MTRNIENSRSHARPVPLRALAVLPIIALAAACSSSGGSSGGSSGSSSGPGGSASSPSAPSSQFPGKKATGSPIRIGIINPEGGATLSQPENRQAALAAVKYANANLGGIGGHVVQTVICKESEDAASARACANQMVQAKVAGVVVTTTGQGDAMAPIITKAGIPYASLAGESTAELTSKNSFIWSGGFPAELASMARYSAEHGYKKVTAFVVNVPAAVGGAQQLGVPTFKAAGIKLNVVGINPGTPDATPQVSSGMAGNPGAVIIINEANGCTSTLKALQTVSPSIPKLTIQPCLSPVTVKAVGSGIEGTKVFTVSDTISGDSESALFSAVMKKYAPDTPTSGYAVSGYAGMLALIRAANGITGGTTAANVIAAVQAAKNVPLPAGHGITFNCDGKAYPGLTAICSTGIIVETVKDGKGTDAQLVK